MGKYHVYNCSCPVCKDECRKLKAIRGSDESISKRYARNQRNDSRLDQAFVRSMVRFLLRVSIVRNSGRSYESLCNIVGVCCFHHPGCDPVDSGDS
mgnify:CR=1 FL=1